MQRTLRRLGAAALAAALAGTLAPTATARAGTAATTGPAHAAGAPARWWATSAGGQVTPSAGAPFLGDLSGIALFAPVVGGWGTPTGQGYWLVAADGGVFAFGDAPYVGGIGGIVLNEPVVGMAATPSGQGYWLVARDGGVFAFGDAPFLGSAAGSPGGGAALAPTPSGRGYWLLGRDGSITAFGDATPLAAAPVGPAGAAAITPGPGGAWVVTRDGQVVTTGSVAAPTAGPFAAGVLAGPVVAQRDGAARAVDGSGVAGLVAAPAAPMVATFAAGSGASTAWGLGVATPRPGAVALTFDDGPDPTWTIPVLDVLDAYDARATFFVVGYRAAAHPELVAEIVRRGHHVAVHGWDHHALTRLGAAGRAEQLTATIAAIEAAGAPTPSCLRPPYGAVSASVVASATAAGLATVMWNVDPQDWRGHSAGRVAAHVIARLGPGRIVLFHDGGTNRANTVAAVGMILEAVTAAGIPVDPIC